MKVFYSLSDLPFSAAPSVVTVGNFDGVHCGHRAVIAQVLDRARELLAQSVVVTFEPHPALVLGKVEHLRLLTPLQVKLKLLAETGVDSVLVLPFTKEMSQWSARDFAEKVLCAALQAAEVHEGENFRFGHAADTGVEGLAKLGEEFCFTVRAAQPYKLRGADVSSSRVRKLLTEGRIASARALLGRSFAVRSTPASGRGYGSRYTVPTINLAEYADLLPKNGVYVTTLSIQNDEDVVTFRGVTNVGNRPTFGKDSFAVESHLFDFEPVELTERTQLELTFLFRLRDERAFANAEALKTQIMADVQRARHYLALASARKALMR